MSSRYDRRTTTFSPDGRLYQVEYAVEAIQQAGIVIGITTKEGVVLVAEKTVQNDLFDDENVEDKNISGEKVFKIADHLGCSVAGISSDAYALLNQARLSAQRHYYAFQEPIAIEDLCRTICDENSSTRSTAGVRPFGVSFLLAGWDRYFGFQLFATEPSGDYNAWSAYAVGQNEQVAQSLLKKEWKEGMTLEEGMVLGLRIISKTMDTLKVSTDRVEMAVLKRIPAPAEQSLLNPQLVMPKTVPQFRVVSVEELKPFIEEAERQRAAEEKEEEEKERVKEQRLS